MKDFEILRRKHFILEELLIGRSIEDIRKKYSLSLKEEMKYMFDTAFIQSMQKDFEQNYEKYQKAIDNYIQLLQRTNKLAGELNFQSALEKANLFTLLLWNGSFSLNQKMIFQSENRLNLDGFYGLDVLLGQGVCLNFSSMLSDFINVSDASACMLLNYVTEDHIRIDYRLQVTQEVTDVTLFQKIFLRLLSGCIKKVGNHVFTLIWDHQKLFIYDATNLTAFYVIDPVKAEVKMGEGTIRLFPFFSRMFVTHVKELEAYHHLFDEKIISYSSDQFIQSSEKVRECFLQNSSLLSDFYESIHPFIEEAVEEITRIRKK